MFPNDNEHVHSSPGPSDVVSPRETADDLLKRLQASPLPALLDTSTARLSSPPFPSSTTPRLFVFDSRDGSPGYTWETASPPTRGENSTGPGVFNASSLGIQPISGKRRAPEHETMVSRKRVSSKNAAITFHLQEIGRKSKVPRDYAGIKDHATLILTLEPTNYYGNKYLTEAHYFLSEFSETIAAATTAISFLPANPAEKAQLYNIRADAKSKTQDYTGALADIAVVQAFDPRNLVAKAILNEVLDQLPSRAYQKLMARDFAGSLADADMVIKHAHPAENKASLYNVSVILSIVKGNTGFSEEALSHINKALELNPQYIPHYSYELRAEYKRMLGDFSGAIVDAELSIQLAPDKSKVTNPLRTKLLAHRSLQEYSAAIKVSRKLLALAPDSANTLIEEIKTDLRSRATHYHQTKNHDNSIADFSLLLELDPTDYRSYHFRGISKEATGDLAGCLADNESACRYAREAKVESSELAICYSKLANALFLAKEYARTIDVYKELLTLRPTDTDPLRLLTILYTLQGQRQEAITYAAKTLEFGSTHVLPTEDLGPPSTIPFSISVGTELDFASMKLMYVRVKLPPATLQIGNKTVELPRQTPYNLVFPDKISNLGLMQQHQAISRSNYSTISTLLEELKKWIKASEIDLETVDSTQRAPLIEETFKARAFLNKMLETRFELSGIGAGTLVTAIYLLGDESQKDELLSLIGSLRTPQQIVALKTPVTETFYGQTFPMMMANNPRLIPLLLDWLIETEGPLNIDPWLPGLTLTKDDHNITLPAHILPNCTKESALRFSNWFLRTVTQKMHQDLIMLAHTDDIGPLGTPLASLITRHNQGYVSAENPNRANSEYLAGNHQKGIFLDNGAGIALSLMCVFISPAAKNFFNINPESLFRLLSVKDSLGMTFPMYLIKNDFILNSQLLNPQLFVDFLCDSSITALLKAKPDQVVEIFQSEVAQTQQTFLQLLFKKLVPELASKLQDLIKEILPQEMADQLIKISAPPPALSPANAPQ